MFGFMFLMMALCVAYCFKRIMFGNADISACSLKTPAAATPQKDLFRKTTETVAEAKKGLSPEIIIKYVDSKGRTTVRGISDIEYRTSIMLNAYCHLRGERRTFYVYKIAEVTNPDTGELLSGFPAKWGKNGRTRYYGGKQ